LDATAEAKPGAWLGPALATALYLALMTALARASGMGFLLFPELGALASVVFADPAGRWARSPLLLAVTPVLTAVPGVLITRSLPYGPLAVALDVGICLLVIQALRSPIVPALSAGLLPLTLGITSWMYPWAIFAGTGGLALLVVLRASLAPAVPTTPPPAVSPLRGPRRWAWIGPMAAFLAGALVLVQVLGSHLVLYPPLLVIAWEMLADRDHCPWLGRPFTVLVVTGGAAVVGLALVQALGVVPQASFLAVLATAWLLRLARLRCPPAFGLTLLPFVIPSPPSTYPLLTLVGTAWLLLVVWLAQRLSQRRADRRGAREWKP
jgi:hypothetical protein